MTSRLPILDENPVSARRSATSDGVDRRGFWMLAVGWAGSLFSLLAAGAAGLRGMIPNLLYEPNLRYRAGRPEDYAPGSVVFVDEIRAFLLRQGNAYRSMSAICTHLGCTVNHSPESGGFRCPCHGSIFDHEGNVLKGPAPRPLESFAMSISRDGRLQIDRDRVVAPDSFLVLDSPGSSPRDEETA